MRGVLDLLDGVDSLLSQIDLMETLDPSRIRENRNLLRNARLHVNEARRRLERTIEPK